MEYIGTTKVMMASPNYGVKSPELLTAFASLLDGGQGN